MKLINILIKLSVIVSVNKLCKMCIKAVSCQQGQHLPMSCVPSHFHIWFTPTCDFHLRNYLPHLGALLTLLFYALGCLCLYKNSCCFTILISIVIDASSIIPVIDDISINIDNTKYIQAFV